MILRGKITKASTNKTSNEPFVDEADRKFWPSDLSPEELRKMGDTIVQVAYINGRIRPEIYGVHVATVGECKGLARRVVRAAWQKGQHALYVESPDGGHGYVHLPTSDEEIREIPADPLILDPTYAQFIDDTVLGREIGKLLQPWDIELTEFRKGVGVERGRHTPDSPYFIGRASMLKAPNSGVLHVDGIPTPWTDPVIPEQPTGRID